MNNKSILLILVLAFFMFSCSEKIASVKPQVKNITESVYSYGIIKSRYQYEVFGKAPAVIKKIFVSEGEAVKIGTPIFKLDNKSLKIATRNAKLASKSSDYRVNSDKLLDAEKVVEMAKKQFDNDFLQYQRQKNLWKNNIGSKITFEQKELSYESAKVNLAKAKTAYKNLKRELKLASDQSKNNLEIAQLTEDDFIIKSEVEGVVYKINKEKGEFINTQQPMAVIGTDTFIIELNIDEFDIIKIKKGQKVIVRMDSYQSQVFEAEIFKINPMMNSKTRSFKADAIFIKSPKVLFPNLTVEANIIINVKKEVVTIPRNYLLNDSTVVLGGGDYQKVVIGLMDYDLVEIKSGITKNTTIQLPQ
ncbi:efflux RND transporter periplasmic adaptor subunit [Tenacibaculum aestuariivivum]|uniref:efflux RND transporter periplasmic adaptor subunit n=1 Tax=Tenacibaculum aestuariivivum TaxID=2006131 RepID=UPI003AB90F00